MALRSKVEKVIVKQGQCLDDIALQEYGDCGAVSLLLEDNGNLQGFGTVLSGGQILLLKQTPINQDVVDYYKRKNIIPCTGVFDGVIQLGGFSNGFSNGFNN